MAYEIVVVGVSTGGLRALAVLLSGLSCKFPLPVAIVQHRGEDSDETLADLLNRSSNLPVSEPEDKETIVGGHTYLAPPDYHLLIDDGHFALSIDQPVLYRRPSIDVLFESAADAYAEKTIGVILTGASSDGARGLARIKERGGLAVVQEPSSSQSRIMPEAALEAAEADQVLPLPEIAPFLATLCGPRGG